jgi:hypothetical protein
MNQSIISIKTKARITGIFFLLTAVTTIFGLLYVRGELILLRDAATTASNITAHESLFRWGIAVNILCQIFQLFLAVALYELFKGVNRTLSLVVLSSKLVSLTLAMAGILGNFAALHLLTKREFFSGFSIEQLNVLMLLFLRLTNEMQGLLEVFWMPTNFCIGLLIIKSKFIPKLFGYLMILGSFGFALNVFIKLLLPEISFPNLTLITMILGSLGGVPIIFWLLIVGARENEISKNTSN